MELPPGSGKLSIRLICSRSANGLNVLRACFRRYLGEGCCAVFYVRIGKILHLSVISVPYFFSIYIACHVYAGLLPNTHCEYLYFLLSNISILLETWKYQKQ